MSGQITSELIRRLIALDCDAATLVLAARFIENPRGGMSVFTSILTALEDHPPHEGFSAFFTNFYNALDWPEPRQPANDEIARMNSSQRRAAYRSLVERDGEQCRKCSCSPSIIWRRMGAWSTEAGGRYTKVHPTTNLEVDHIEPLWAGGDNVIENLWLLCVDCHKEKTAYEAGQRRRA